jgi:hypothetical protein
VFSNGGASSRIKPSSSDHQMTLDRIQRRFGPRPRRGLGDHRPRLRQRIDSAFVAGG